MIEDEVNIESRVPHIAKLETGETFVMNIPECCREGHDDCPHVAKPYKPSKRNIGL